MELKKQKAYKSVFDMACADFLRLDPSTQCRNAGADYRGQGSAGSVDIPYFDEVITLGLPGFSFKSSKDVNVTLVAKIIILHYLVRAPDMPLKDELVAYEDIPGARHYLPVFERRVTRPLALAFGYNRDAFVESGIALGGTKEDYGNASFTLTILPRVPVTFILWEGDEEFPPSVRTLFNPSVSAYLSLEDIVVLSKMAVTRIVKTARKKYAGEEMSDI